MAQDIVNENQKISYTNLDFSSIYTEVIDLIKQLTYRWDPSISDESDPGVVLVKLSALIADKCNYNIDKNILETFPLSVTQEGNARQLYDQLGYYMDWYESAYVPVTLSWIGDTTDSSISYTIPKFTMITDSESSKRYALIGTEGEDGVIVSNVVLSADGNTVTALAMEGTPVQYQFEGESVITSQMVDPISRRLYFTKPYISQNGVFIKNTGQENYASWKRVNNLYENSYNELRYVFGYDSTSDACFLEFPDNYDELFGSGIEITYLIIDPAFSNIPAQSLTQFLSPISISGDTSIVLDSSNVKITNYISSYGHKDVESIDDAYINYKRTVGTFKTLVTLRDYLNFIRNAELDICSNAFVCDRTNDIQSTYKIMSQQEGLKNIVVKVEQKIDKTSIESTFDYKFTKTDDTSVDPSKTYYIIYNNTLEEVDSPSGNPSQQNFYELVSIEPKSEDILKPFSLKFYLLRKAISLNNKTAFNETFNIMNPYPDFDSLLSDTAHLEHTYEDILPLGENTYVKSLDATWESDKSYWLYDSDYNTYELIGDTSVFDTSPAENSNVYEIDVEALLPHTVFFKALYPVYMNISTYNVLDTDTQVQISSNIINNLYSKVNSSQIDFGDAISVDYLIETVKNSDDRIKNVSIDPINYELFGIYYDKEEDSYVEVAIDDDLSSFIPNSYSNMSDLVSVLMKKDIVCKSILGGTTQLLVPDSDFIYHLSQQYVSYINDINNITGEAIIDIQNDSTTSYSLDETNSFIRKSYTLKDNEILSLYRPKLIDTKEFLNGVHFEYVLYHDIAENTSYRLANSEYIIMYTPIKAEDGTSIVGYTAYACSTGCIVQPSFDMKIQNSVSSLTSFAKAKILPHFIANPFENYYEISTYNENYKTEIRNSSTVVNNSISGNNSIKVQEIANVTIEISDKYKFFWVLNEPTYSIKDNLKTYTLFDEFDSEENNQYSDMYNVYTLRNGEYLYYTNEDATSFQPLGPGTTIIRNCGVDSAQYTPIKNSLYYVNINDLSSVVEDATFDFLTDNENKIRPFENGLFECPTIGSPESLSSTDNPFALGLYEINSVSPLSLVPTFDTKPVTGTDYYDAQSLFIRTTDTEYHSNKSYYVLVMRKGSGEYVLGLSSSSDGTSTEIYTVDSVDSGCFEEADIYAEYSLINPSQEGLYEIVEYNNNKFIDSYALSENAQSSRQYRYTSTTDTSVITRNILDTTIYSGVNLIDTHSYTSLNMSNIVISSPETLGLLTPTYKTYYTDSTGQTEAIVNYLTVPNDSENTLYEESSPGVFVQTTDPTPEIIKVEKTSSIELLKEVNGSYETNILNKGYFYKPNSSDTVYSYNDAKSTSFLNASDIYNSAIFNRSPLTYLYILYTNTRVYDPEGTDALLDIYGRWNDAVSFQRPYTVANDFSSNNTYYYGDIVLYNNLSYRCITSSVSGDWDATKWVRTETSWATYDFVIGGTINPLNPILPSNAWIKVPSTAIIEKAVQLRQIYPAFTSEDSDSGVSSVTSDFFISGEFYDQFASDLYIHDTDYNYYVINTDLNDNPVFVYLDSDLKLARLFPNIKNDVSNYASINMFYMPKLYMFNDFVKYTYKNYYVAKSLYSRNCGTIPAWTCTAIDNDYIADNPIANIQNLWVSLQNNTSVTIIQNEIRTFSAGDIVIFEADESSESSVIWPTFNNNEYALDLDSYKVSYQKKGEDIEDLENINVDEYKWRGYSSLLLNTSSKSGQRLSYNHSLLLYNDENKTEPIATISGSANDNITFQLKYPVVNKSGTFIDVSTIDTFGESISNSLYAFIPLSNGDYYSYVTNTYDTNLYFNSNNSDDLGPQDITLPIGLPGGNYLLAMNMKDGTNLTIDYRYTLDSCDLTAPAVASSSSSGDLAYKFDPEFNNYLHSYMNDDRIVFTNDKFDYILLEVPNGFVQVTLPSLVTQIIDKTPYELDWYVKSEDGYEKVSIDDYNIKGSSLLIEVTETSGNPVENGWYVFSNSEYSLSTDTSMQQGTTYYTEPELYASLLDITSSLIFSIDNDKDILTYTIKDIFKFENNPLLGDGFELIKEKLQRLDVDEEYNYTFIPTSNDLIENPLTPKSFWNSNHVYNSFIIPQLNFDKLDTRFVTTK